MIEEKAVCPKCGNEVILHFNYDYSKKELPFNDVLCNECGEFFELGNQNFKLALDSALHNNRKE